MLTKQLSRLSRHWQQKNKAEQKMRAGEGKQLIKAKVGKAANIQTLKKVFSLDSFSNGV